MICGATDVLIVATHASRWHEFSSPSVIVSESPNISPFFARDAAAYLAEGNTQHAIELCLQGTKAFPQYSTGHLVLGKCYEAFGRTMEALAAYKLALKILPDNATLQALVKLTGEKQQEEYKKFSAEQQQKLGAEKDTVSAQEFFAKGPASEESAIEFLAKRLQDVKRIQPKVTTSSDGVAPPIKDDRSVKFVTATMAEIYATQGEYTEAISAYRELLRQHPEEHVKYEGRISEIGQLLEMQQREKKLQPPEAR